MEKIVNKKGSVTVEAVVIVPVILIFIATVIYLMVVTFEKSEEHMLENHQRLQEQAQEMTQIQQAIESALYLVDRIKE